MYMKKLKFFLSVTLLLLMSSCTHRIADLTLVSTKNYSTSKPLKVAGSKVVGEDKASIIVFLPTGTVNVEEAVDNAIEQTPGAVALQDVVIISKWFYIPYIYGEQKIIVEGTPLKQ